MMLRKICAIVLTMTVVSGWASVNSEVVSNDTVIVASSPGSTVLKEYPEDYFPAGSEGWFVIPEGVDKGKKLFFYDRVFGEGEPESTILFVHGNPETSYTYSKGIKELVKLQTKSSRVIAMDHIGFGLSDQASFEMVDMHHSNNLLQLVEYLDLQNVTLVVHDWGGAIGIGALIQQPERVTSLVILNTTVFPISKEGKYYGNFPGEALSWTKTPNFVPDFLWGNTAAFVYGLQPLKPTTSTKFVMSWLGYQFKVMFGLLNEQEEVYQQIYAGQFDSSTINARSSQRMVRQTSDWGYGWVYEDPTMGTQDNRAYYQYMQDNITRVWGPDGQNIPARGLFGEWDVLAKQSVLDQWTNALPQLNGNIELFENTTHFVEESKSAELAQAIISVSNLD